MDELRSAYPTEYPQAAWEGFLRSHLTVRTVESGAMHWAALHAMGRAEDELPGL